MDRNENNKLNGVLFLGNGWNEFNNYKFTTVKQIKEGILDEVPFWTPESKDKNFKRNKNIEN